MASGHHEHEPSGCALTAGIVAFVVLCACPVALTLLAAVYIAGSMLYDPKPETMSILEGSATVAIGFAALAFTMASALDASEYPSTRVRLTHAGVVVALGGVLFLTAVVSRFATLHFGKANWWINMNAFDKQAVKWMAAIFIVVVYELGAALFLVGFVLMLWMMWWWLFFDRPAFR